MILCHILAKKDHLPAQQAKKPLLPPMSIGSTMMQILLMKNMFSKASDYKRGFQRLDDKGRAIVTVRLKPERTFNWLVTCCQK